MLQTIINASYHLFLWLKNYSNNSLAIQRNVFILFYSKSWTNVYIQNHWSTALNLLGKTTALNLLAKTTALNLLGKTTARNLLGKTARTHIVLSPETPWTLYNYRYLEDNTAYGAKYWWHNWAHNKKQKTSKTWNIMRYSVSNKHKPSRIPSRECNNCIWASVVQLVAKISERHRKC